jgi:hypothetical protein
MNQEVKKGARVKMSTTRVYEALGVGTVVLHVLREKTWF